jgi:hypothetical protein
MANTLQSPGVSVSVIDESFYTPAAPGTVPLIFVASAANKTNSSGVTAVGTVPAAIGQAPIYTITSQMDLANTFGTPLFPTDSQGNSINGGEQNEYGLQAAYSLLGVSSKAYVVRANIDLSELTASASVPTGNPVNGTYWLDTGNTQFGIYEWDAVNKVFVLQMPLIIDDSNSASNTTDGETPSPSFGTLGAYAVVATSGNMGAVWYKNMDNNWVLIGSNAEQEFGTPISGSKFKSYSWETSYPLITSAGFSGVVPGSTFSINGHQVTIGSTSTAQVATTINTLLPTYGVGAKVNSEGYLELYADASASSNGSTMDGNIAITGNAVNSLGLTTSTFAPVALTIAPHTQVPRYAAAGVPSGSVYIKTTAASVGANWVVKLYNASTGAWSVVSAPIYSSTDAGISALDPVGGGSNIAVGTLMVESNFDGGAGADGSPQLAEFKILRRTAVKPTTVTGSVNVSSLVITKSAGSTATYELTVAETVPGASGVTNTATIIIATIPASTVTSHVTIHGSDIATAISAAGFQNLSANVSGAGYLTITHALGGDIQITDSGTIPVLADLGFTALGNSPTANLYEAGMYDSYTVKASNWAPLVFEGRAIEPTTTPANGKIWYGSNLEDVDILYHNGTTWVGYQYDGTGHPTQGTTPAFPNSDPNGPIVAASQPSTQSDGTALENGDIWVDSSATDIYGQSVYVYDGNLLTWVAQDVTDHVTPNGWVFADARWSDAGQDDGTYIATIKSLLVSNYLDPDAPDPALYPEGTRLWNLRRSGFNVKKYETNYINIYDNNGFNIRYQNDPMDNLSAGYYSTARWVTVSPNDHLGVGQFGRYAQRSFVIEALKGEIDANVTLRDTDNYVFNVIACPGYPEAIQNMVALNSDRGYTGFVVGDTPFRLQPNATSLATWGGNIKLAADNGEIGAVSYDDYMAMFYPSGYTNDNTGNYIVVPPSHMMLRTITNSDAKSYQWFAPSGINRGTIDNATSAGYVDAAGDFITTNIPQSIRDVLAGVKVNPISTINGVGLVNFGNYTRSHVASALDRINVARLVAYLRRQLGILAQPYLFEPNDSITRQAIKNAAESLFIELVGQRAIYDYIVVCDESNNTPARIDRSELWMDIAIEPVKAVEFIYIPMRLLNTGAIASGNLGSMSKGS